MKTQQEYIDQGEQYHCLNCVMLLGLACLVLLLIFPGCETGVLLEVGIKIGVIIISDLLCNLCDGYITIFKQLLGLLHSKVNQILFRPHSNTVFKHAIKMAAINVKLIGEL